MPERLPAICDNLLGNVIGEGPFRPFKLKKNLDLLFAPFAGDFRIRTTPIGNIQGDAFELPSAVPREPSHWGWLSKVTVSGHTVYPPIYSSDTGIHKCIVASSCSGIR
jgi:hypothetical protein